VPFPVSPKSKTPFAAQRRPQAAVVIRRSLQTQVPARVTQDRKTLPFPGKSEIQNGLAPHNAAHAAVLINHSHGQRVPRVWG
jgi:hypothetical protein